MSQNSHYCQNNSASVVNTDPLFWIGFIGPKCIAPMKEKYMYPGRKYIRITQAGVFFQLQLKEL